MSSWGKQKEKNQLVAGANTVAGLKYGYQPSEFQGGYVANKRNVIATDKGWVRRSIKKDVSSGAVRLRDEMLVPIGGLANSTNLGFPDIAQIYFSGKGTGATSTSANIYVVFNEPVKYSGAGVTLKLAVANTVSGNAMVAKALRSNSNTGVVLANNTLVFKFTPTVAGTYKVQAQTIANTATGTANLVSYNTGAEAANLIIVGAVSNTAGVFTAV